MRTYPPVIPPETEIYWPVIHRLFSEARSSTASAMSSTVPNLSSALVSGTRNLCMASAAGLSFITSALPSAQRRLEPQRTGRATCWYGPRGNCVHSDTMPSSELFPILSAMDVPNENRLNCYQSSTYLRSHSICQSITRCLGRTVQCDRRHAQL